MSLDKLEHNINEAEIAETADNLLANDIAINDFLKTLDEIKEMAKGNFTNVDKDIVELYPNWKPGDFIRLLDEIKRKMFSMEKL